MKQFTTSEEATSEVFDALQLLKRVCAKHNLSVIAAVATGCKKVPEEGGVEMTVEMATMSTLVGVDKTPPELAMINSLIKEGGSMKALEASLAMHRHMEETYGALLAEDNPQEACEHYAVYGDMDAARRIGGSLT